MQPGQSTLIHGPSDNAISQLKVAFLCPSLSRTSFGIFETERRLAQCLHELRDTEVEVFGPADEYLIVTAIKSLRSFPDTLRRSGRLHFAIRQVFENIS